eukprot:2207127-Alexandrium_andersonii.AAC.1
MLGHSRQSRPPSRQHIHQTTLNSKQGRLLLAPRAPDRTCSGSATRCSTSTSAHRSPCRRQLLTVRRPPRPAAPKCSACCRWRR